MQIMQLMTDIRKRARWASFFFFFQAEDGIRDLTVTGVQTCALPICQHVDLPEGGLVLAPAERADLIVDFRSLRGQSLRLVNTAGAPFDNSPSTQPAGDRKSVV